MSFRFFKEYLSFTIITYVSSPRRFNDRIAMMIARMVTMEEMAPAMARLPVLKMAPRRGVSKVAPQVGQPAPSAIRPVMMPAFSRFSEFWPGFSRFLSQSKIMSPIRMPWRMAIRKIGSQSENAWSTPKMARKLLPMICKL